MSTRGRSSNRTPGARRRRGPSDENGLARSAQIGSVKTFTPSTCSSIVEWFTNVARNSSPSTPEGGLEGSTSKTKRGDGSGRLVSFHRRASKNPCACGAFGLKKRRPSKCFGNGQPGLASFSTPPSVQFQRALNRVRGAGCLTCGGLAIRLSPPGHGHSTITRCPRVTPAGGSMIYPQNRCRLPKRRKRRLTGSWSP
jgi:hypothetical protein